MCIYTLHVLYVQYIYIHTRYTIKTRCYCTHTYIYIYTHYIFTLYIYDMDTTYIYIYVIGYLDCLFSLSLSARIYVHAMYVLDTLCVHICFTSTIYIYIYHLSYYVCTLYTLSLYLHTCPYIIVYTKDKYTLQYMCLCYLHYVYIYIYICSIYAYFNMLEDTWSTAGGCCLKYPTEVRPDGRGAFMKLPERLPGGPIWRANHPGNSWNPWKLQSQKSE